MVHCVKRGVKALENSLLIKGFSASGSKNALTIACSRQRTRCPFVCMLASSHFRTQTAITCTAADAGVGMIPFVNRDDKKSANRS